MTRETKAILNMLENEEDIKFYILDRFAGRKIEDEEVFTDTASDLAFVLEDELRSNSRHHFIDISMWGEIVMPYQNSGKRAPRFSHGDELTPK